jgi:hypothetical protein
MRNSDPAQLIVLLCLVGLSGPVQGMGFYSQDPTLCQEAGRCDLLVYGMLKLPDPKAEQTSKEVIVTDVIRPHWLVGGAKVIRLDRDLPVEDRRCQPRYLFYCDVFRGQIEVYRGVEATPAVVPYVKGLLAIGDKEQLRRLRYCFSYLEHPDEAIALDAYRELRDAPRADLIRAAPAFSAPKLRRMLQAPATPAVRLPFYYLLLGCCGKEEDAALLRKVADRYVSEQNPNLRFEEVLVGYTLLRPKDGRDLAHSLLKRPLRPFAVRYTVLLMADFFHEHRLAAMPREQAVDLARATLDQEDINDLGIDRLRRWRCWKACEDVLSAPVGNPITRRAIARYALQCPDPRAADFVTKLRASDPELVEDVEEWLKEAE